MSHDRSNCRSAWHLGRTLLLIVAASLLGGCGSARFSSTFTEDGTAQHSLEIAFQRASVIERDLPTLNQEIIDADARAHAAGLTSERIDTPELLGIRISSTTENAVDAGAALNNLLNTLLPDTDLGPIAPFQGTFNRQSEAVGGNEFDLQLTVNGDLLLQTVQIQAPGNRQLGTPEGVREVIAIDYTATLPGKIKQTNGATLDENTVRWAIPLAGITAIDATSTVGKDTPWFWLIVTLIGAGIVTMLVASGITRLLNARRSRGKSRLYIASATVGGHSHRVISEAKPPGTIADVIDALVRLIKRLVSGRRYTLPPPPESISDQAETGVKHGIHAERD